MVFNYRALSPRQLMLYLTDIIDIVISAYSYFFLALLHSL
jgi:hypothetical protein